LADKKISAMPLKKVILPAMGEGITDASIIRWLVSEGEMVLLDQPLVEIATDKVDSELPSPYEGILKKIIAQVGEIPKVGETIAFIQVGDDEAVVITEELTSSVIKKEKIKPERKQVFKAIDTISIIQSENKPFIPPYVRLSALKLGVELDSLIRYSQKRKGEVLNKSDLEYFVKNREFNQSIVQQQQTIHVNKPLSTTPEISSNGNISFEGNVEKIPMTRIRKKIAENMLLSSKSIPHVTSFIEADSTNLVVWRESNKERFHSKYSTKLTLTPIFIETMVAAIKKFPQVNASTDGENIYLKTDINIGMATVLPDGNLIVPVVKNADKLSLSGMATQVNDLSERARKLELKPNEITGSTFTFTNIGVFGTLTGTPLINVPEAAILSIGAINKKPSAIATSDGYAIGLRDIVMLSLAYDHRIIDGSLGGLFLKAMKEFIEGFDPKREI
jgi:2-oxoglutarate dehydrogenase E2 component (dihydrolipoamide succinyltransferase)